MDPATQRHYTGIWQPEGLTHLRPEFDVAKYPPHERDDDGVLEVTLQHFRLSCSRLTELLARFRNVEALRLIDTRTRPTPITSRRSTSCGS
jgi:hypothetical protein